MGEASRLKKQKEEMFNKKMIKLVRFCWFLKIGGGWNHGGKYGLRSDCASHAIQNDYELFVED